MPISVLENCASDRTPDFRNATTNRFTFCDQGWVTLAGAPLVGGVWYTATGLPEPNDRDDGVENGGQQLGILDRVETYLQDAVGDSLYGGVCECNAVAVSATAQGYVDADPNNPN